MTPTEYKVRAVVELVVLAESASTATAVAEDRITRALHGDEAQLIRSGSVTSVTATVR